MNLAEELAKRLPGKSLLYLEICHNVPQLYLDFAKRGGSSPETWTTKNLVECIPGILGHHLGPLADLVVRTHKVDYQDIGLVMRHEVELGVLHMTEKDSYEDFCKTGLAEDIKADCEKHYIKYLEKKLNANSSSSDGSLQESSE